MELDHAQVESPRKRQRIESPRDSYSTDLQNVRSDGRAVDQSISTIDGGRQRSKPHVEKSREVRAGILAYVNGKSRGFSGILKTRYTDFLVNEISSSGHVLHLTSLELPDRLQQVPPKISADEPSVPKEDIVRPDPSQASVSTAEGNDVEANGDAEALEVSPVNSIARRPRID